MLGKRVSFIIPAFNEQKNIGIAVERIIKAAQRILSDYEIILINDGSTDKTGKVAERLASKNKKITVVNNESNMGMGYSYWVGIERAKFEYAMIIFGDGDQPMESIKIVLEKIGEADMIIPFYTNFAQTKTWFRHLLSTSYTHLINNITGLMIFYYNGITLHKTHMVKSLKGLSDGFGFQSEIIVSLIKGGASFIQVGIINDEEKNKKSAALRISNIFRVVISLARFAIKYR